MLISVTMNTLKKGIPDLPRPIIYFVTTFSIIKFKKEINMNFLRKSNKIIESKF